MHPREFGKYRIVKLLPVGGMGRVYLALDTDTNQQVALKLIEIGPGPEQQEIVEAERRGAILQARLCGIDPRIVRIDAFGDFDDFFFIEMEYVEGQDLSEVLARGVLGVPFAARIGADLCEVLNTAHTFRGEIEGHQYHGIVHGDIKPRNIRITHDGQVKVLDFGIAKALSLTRKFTQNLFGSSQYSSPERLNTGEVDIASDLWSVGVVLYEIVSGKPYFQAESGARLENLIRNYRELQPLPEHLPLPFRMIVRKALSPDPSRRYGSAADFAADLRAFLTGRPTVAESEPAYDVESTRRTVRAAATGDEAPTVRTSAPELDDATRRSPSASLPRPAGAPGGMPSPPASPSVRGQKTPKAPLSPRMRQVRALGGALLTILVCIMFYNEYWVWKQAHELRRELETERLTDLNAAWSRYDALSRTSMLPPVLSGTRNAIEQKLTAVADRVIDEYRNSDAPSVNEADWQRAQASLAHALELDPGDKTIRGKLYVTEGHINRIRADARRQPRLYAEARGRFEQARELMPKSPDPYLGLARLYAYAFRDVDRAEDALKQASKRGHPMGRREKAQLADAFRDRAEKLVAEADRSSGLPEEQDFLKRAQKDMQRAEDLYRGIVPFAGSATSLRRVLDYLATIDLRLQAIKEGA